MFSPSGVSAWRPVCDHPAIGSCLVLLCVLGKGSVDGRNRLLCGDVAEHEAVHRVIEGFADGCSQGCDRVAGCSACIAGSQCLRDCGKGRVGVFHLQIRIGGNGNVGVVKQDGRAFLAKVEREETINSSLLGLVLCNVRAHNERAVCELVAGFLRCWHTNGILLHGH